jgi:uncharacterized protein YuzE
VTTAEQVVSVKIDQDAGAAYVQLSVGHVARTVEFSEQLNIDLDRHGVVIGIELLDLGRAIPLDDIARRYHIRTEALRTLLASLVRSRPQTTVAGSTVAGQLPFGTVQPSRVAVSA